MENHEKLSKDIRCPGRDSNTSRILVRVPIIFYSIACFGSRFNFSFVIFDMYLFDYGHVSESLLGLFPVLSYEPLLVDKTNTLHYFSIRNTLVTAAESNTPSPSSSPCLILSPDTSTHTRDCHNKSFKNRISSECYKVTDFHYTSFSFCRIFRL